MSARLEYGQAITALTGLGYGRVSARGLLELADASGTHTDGNVTVRSGRNGYRIES